MGLLRRWLRRPIGVASVSGALAMIVVGSFLVVSANGLSGFVHAAPPYTDGANAPSSLEVLPSNHGFDGQFYYRMAVAPASTAARVAGVAFDIPALRQQRVGYPLLVWGMSLGDPIRIPFALIALNVVALFLMGWFGAIMAREAGRHLLWGLLFPLYPGFVYSLGFDLSEIVATTFVLATLLALHRRRIALAAATAAFAVLTRETTAILPLALLIAALWPRSRGGPDRDQRRAWLVVGFAPFVAAGSWHLWLRSKWGSFPLSESGDKNIRFPFSGLLDVVGRFVPPTSSAAAFRVLSLAFLLLVIALAGVTLRRSTAPLYAKVAFAMSVVLVTLLSGSIWEGATSFMRAATETYVFAVVIVVSARLNVTRTRLGADRLLALSTVAAYGLTVGAQISKS